jgi:hypothetical protein
MVRALHSGVANEILDGLRGRGLDLERIEGL